MRVTPFRAALAACAMFVTGAPAFAQAPPIDAYERQDRIEELERQLQQATDENDRLQFQLQQAQAEVRRLQGMVTDLAAVRDARDEVESGRAPPAPAANQGQREASAPGPRNAQGKLGTLEGADLPPSDAGEAYQRARGYLLANQIRLAEDAFADFVARFGTDVNAPEARYWHAFTLLAREANTEAAAGFVDYLRRYPRGRRAPDSMVRLGVALKALGRNAQACQAFADFTRTYPNAAQNLRDLAARETRALRCTA